MKACRTCGVDISYRAKQARRCSPCAKKRERSLWNATTMERRKAARQPNDCKECGQTITDRLLPHRAIYCAACLPGATKRRLHANYLRDKARRKIRRPPPVPTKIPTARESSRPVSTRYRTIKRRRFLDLTGGAG